MEGQVLNISPLVVWVVALSQLLSFGLTLYSLFASGSKRNAAKIEEHAERLVEHDKRLGMVEQGLEGIPTQKDFHVLESMLTKMTGSIDVLSERMKPMQAITERLQDWMMEQGKK